MGKIAVEEKTTTTQKEKNKQAIQNINKSGTVSGKSSGVSNISGKIVTDNTKSYNLSGTNSSLGTPKMTTPSKTNVLGKASTQEKGKTFVPQNTKTTNPLNVPKTSSTMEKIKSGINSFLETAGTETGRMKLKNDYTAQRNQQKLDQVNKENMDLASQTRNEDIPRMFNADGSKVDYSNQKKDLQNQIAQLDSYINDIADETVTAAEISRRNELQQQLDEFDLLERKASAIEELNAQEILKGDDLKNYQEMLSHKNDSMFERIGNVVNHLGNTTANIIPTAFDQMKEMQSNAYAKENIAELNRMHESGEVDDATYKEALSEWQDYIDRNKSTNSDNLSQIIRANADQLSANTYYGANEIEKFCLQAGESTAQFLLHYVLLGEAATVSMSLASGTDRMNQLLMEGVDPQIAAQNGFMTGLVSYATEKIGMDRFVNMMGTPFSADALGSIIVSQLKSGLSEGLEELAEGLVDPVIDSVTLGVPYTVDGNELKMEFLLGGASGLAMAIGGTAIGTVNAGIQVNSLLNERREIRADVQERISNLVVESQYQKNLLINEINMFKKHYNSMTETQKQVAQELIAKGENAIKNYESMSQVQGVLFSSDIPYESSTEENNYTIYQTYAPNFNQEVQFEQKVNETENLINGLLDEQLALEGIANETQNILNEGGYNIDSKVFNSLNPDQQTKALVALDFAKIMGMNVQVVNNLPSGQNGYVDPSTGNIVIDGTKRSILSTLSHELTHGTESSKYYSLLKDLAMANIEGDWNDIVNQKIEDYAKGNIELDFENAEKEVVARYVEDKLGDENFIDNLVRYNFNLASKIYQDLKAMGSDEEIDKVRNAFEKAFNDKYQQNEKMFSLDVDYMDAVNNGDMKTAKELVKKAARENGYTVDVYHGTYDFGKTKFTKYDGVLFLTDDPGVANNFSGGQPVRDIAGKFDVKTAPIEDVIKWVEGNTYASEIRKATSKDFAKEEKLYKPDKSLLRYGQDIYDHAVRASEKFKEIKEDFESGTPYYYMPYNSIAGVREIPNLTVFPESRIREFAEEYHSDGRRPTGGGVYQMYLRPENMLEIEVGGNYYTDVPIPNELREYARPEELKRGYATSDQILRMAYEAGYGTIKYADMTEGGDWGNAGVSNVYVSMDAPRNVKSADPIVYDDNGNVIPLSERFNPENDDIRYSYDSEDGKYHTGNATVDEMMNNIIESMSYDELMQYFNDGEFEYATAEEVEEDPEIQDEGLWIKDPEGDYIKIDDGYTSDGRTVAWKDDRIKSLVKSLEDKSFTLPDKAYRRVYAINLSPHEYRALSYIFEPRHNEVWQNDINSDPEYYNNREFDPNKMSYRPTDSIGYMYFMVDTDGTRAKIVGQEGNHRSIILDESGYSKMPILLFANGSLDGTVILEGMNASGRTSNEIKNPNKKLITNNDYMRVASYNLDDLIDKFGSGANADISYSYDSENDIIDEETNDELERLQKPNSALSEEQLALYKSRDPAFLKGVRGRIETLFRSRYDSSSSSNNDSKRIIKVSGDDFYEFFKANKNYLKNPETVDLLNKEDYQDGTAYMSNNGLSGFYITKDGDLKSVFNDSGKHGFPLDIADIVKKNAYTLDCFQSEQNKLADMYAEAFGFKVASILDFNRKVMEDEHGKEFTRDFIKKYGKAPIYFMVKTDQDVKTEHFNKDQWQEAYDYRNSFVNKVTDDLNVSEEEMKKYKMIKPVTERTKSIDKNIDKNTGVYQAKGIIELESTIGKTTHEEEIKDGEEYAGKVAQQLDNGADPEDILKQLKANPLNNGLIRAYYTSQVLADRGLKPEYMELVQWARDIDNLGGKLVESTKILYDLSDTFSRAVYLTTVQDNLVDEYKLKYGNKDVDVDKIINEIFQKSFDAITHSETVREFRKAVGNLAREVNRVMPKTIWDRITQYRMIAMLSGTKTAVSNFISNVFTTGLYRMKDFNQAAIEAAVQQITVKEIDDVKQYGIKQGDRQTTFKLDKEATKRNKAAAKEIFDQLEEASKTKYGEDVEKIPDIIKKRLKEAHSTTKKPIAKALDNLTELVQSVQQTMLDDTMFTKGAFVYKFNQLAQARGIDVRTVDRLSKEFNKLVDDAYDYAEEVVSHDATDISNTLSNLQKRSAKNVRVNQDSTLVGLDTQIKRFKEKANEGQPIFKAIDAVIRRAEPLLVPFYKTNASVMKKALQYSPLEIVQVINDYSRVKANKMDLVDMVEHMAKFATGTELYILGAIFSRLGWLKWDKDDEDYTGRLIVKIPGTDKGITADFIDPVSTIFTKGVVLNQELMEEGVSFKFLADLVNDYEDIFLADELDMFSTMKDFFDTVGKVRKGKDDYGDYTLADGAADVSFTILNSYIPAIVRDISRIVDPAKKVTYTSDQKKYLLNRLLNSTPFRTKLVDKKDATGNTLTYTQPYTKNDLANRIITQMVSRGKLVDMEGKAITTTQQNPENKLGENASEFTQMAQDFQFKDDNGDGYSDQHWIRDTVPTNIYPGNEQVELTPEEKDTYGKTWTETWTTGANLLLNNDTYKNLSYENQADVVYELQSFSRRVIEAEYCQNNKMDMTDSQKTALKLKEFCTKNGKLNGDLLSLIALGTAKENKLSNGGQQYVLGKKGEDGKTIRNSRQLYMRQLYEEAGVYDDILKAVESGEFEYADFGLSKTVVKQSEDKSKANYQDIYNKTMSKSNGSKTSGRKAKKGSSKKVSGGSLKGGGSVNKLTQAKLSPAKNTNLNFFKAYQSTFNQKKGTKVSESGSSSQVCPNCGARVSANASRCPNCGAKL